MIVSPSSSHIKGNYEVEGHVRGCKLCHAVTMSRRYVEMSRRYADEYANHMLMNEL